MVTNQLRKKARTAAQFLAPVFAYRGWRWASLPGFSVPTEEDIYGHIVEFMEDMEADSSVTSESSGRIMVTVNREGGRPYWYHIYLSVPDGE